MKPPVGIIVGSNRRASINRRLAKALANLVSERLDLHWIAIDGLPMYNQDLEGMRPDVVNRFTAEIAAMVGLLFVTPEHNRSVPAVLKNAIDWGSKPTDRNVWRGKVAAITGTSFGAIDWGSKPTDRNVWRGKVAAITGTSFGAIGTAVGQQHLRQILGILGVLVMGGEAYISFSPDPVDEDGHFLDASKRAFCEAYMNRFVDLVMRFAP